MNEDVVRSMITRVFPAAQRHLPGGIQYASGWESTWLRNRRVAHAEVLRLYLERIAGEGLQAFREAEQAWQVMADKDALDDYLRWIDPERLEDVIGSLEAYEDLFSSEHVVPAVTVLLNLLPELPDRQRGMFDLDARLVVGRVVYRLLRVVGDQDALADAVRAILPQVTTLSSKYALVSDVGYQEGSGHKLVTEDAAAAFEAAWRSEVRSASPEQLASERDLREGSSLRDAR